MAPLMSFFFQAEDGIRDYKVTGVQTCALPISLPCRGPRCILGAALRSPACTGQPVPARVASRFDQATRFVEQAARRKPKQARKLLTRARKALKQGASAAMASA